MKFPYEEELIELSFSFILNYLYFNFIYHFFK